MRAAEEALDGVTTEEVARRLLDALDAAMLAAEDKRRALSLPPPADHAAEDGVIASLRGGREDASEAAPASRKERGGRR